MYAHNLILCCTPDSHSDLSTKWTPPTQPTSSTSPANDVQENIRHVKNVAEALVGVCMYVCTYITQLCIVQSLQGFFPEIQYLSSI